MQRYLRLIVFVLIPCYLTVNAYGQKKAKLTPAEKENIKTAKVMIVRYQAPPLSFMTPKDAVGEGLVAKITESDKADAQEQHSYYPSRLVQEHIATLLNQEGLATNLVVEEQAYEFHMPAELKDLSKYQNVDADYIIEIIVPLMGWQASYNPIKWRTYWLNLAVETRIIKKDGLTRIWKTNVGHGGLNDKQLKFHISELEEDGKKKIADMLEIAAVENSRKVVDKFVQAKK